MKPHELTSVLDEVRRLRRGFAHTAPRAWTPSTAAAELTVQLGHLALCLLHRRGTPTADLDDPVRPIGDIGDELADVLLASLSVSTLAAAEPSSVTYPLSDTRDEADEVAVLLRLLVASGRLAEAGMISDGVRHMPTGARPAIPTATAVAVAACEALARQLGLDLVAEFRAMVSDADAFLAITKTGSQGSHE